MRNYEVVLILHPDLDETATTGIIEKVNGWITEGTGTVDRTDIWGRRRMAYSIKKQREGQYVYMEATMPPTFSNELERNLRLNESVLRFMITAR